MLAMWLTLVVATAAGADVVGSVQDPSRAGVPGARVTLVSEGGVDVGSAATDAQGQFRISVAAAGRYRVRVESPGFKTAIAGVRTGAAVRVTLALSDLRQELTVEGAQSQVNTEAAGNLDTVRLDRETLRRLPVLGNDVIGAAAELLSSGVLGTGGVSMVVDGMETREKGVTSSAIQEVRINNNPYSAEYARPGRGRLEVITKPGDPEFHGELNVIFRDSAMDARNAFAATKAEEQRRIFEGNFTGPLGRNGRTTFLISGNHEEEDLQSLVYALTPAGEVRENFPAPARQTEFNGKVTRQIGKAQTVAVRYEFADDSQRGNGVGGFDLPERASDSTDREHHLYLNYRGVWSKSVVNEFSLRGGRHNARTVSRVRGAPAVSVVDAFTGGSGQADSHQTENHVQFTDTVVWTRGRHLVKMGISLPDLSRRGENDLTNRMGTYYFSSLADYESDRAFSYIVQRGDGRVVFWQKELGLFVQDDFKLRPNLSISVGLRYDWQSHLTDANNFAPRLSMAWVPGRSRKTVLRLGGGIFFDRTGDGAIGDTIRFDGQHLERAIIDNPPYPGLPGGVGGLAAQPSLRVRFGDGLRSPYLAQFSFGVERELTKKLALTVGVTGVRGIKTFRSRDANGPLPPDYWTRPEPELAVVRVIDGPGRMASQALDVGLRGPVTKYFQGQIQYTFGTARNNTAGISALPANSYYLEREWGYAPFDMRHRFILLGVVRPEKLFHLGVKVTANTGTPYGLTTGRDENRDGYAADRPEGVWRNTMRGPGQVNLDLRWSREFALIEGKKDDRLSMEFVADAFNVLNHVNEANRVGNLSSAFFGQATAARAARRVQLGVTLKF
jgi:hypothetical protein